MRYRPAPPRSVASRITAILSTFLTGESHSITEIAHMTGLPVSTTHRISADLAAWQLLQRAADGRYGVGSILQRLGGDAVAAPELEAWARRGRPGPVRGDRHAGPVRRAGRRRTDRLHRETPRSGADHVLLGGRHAARPRIGGGQGDPGVLASSATVRLRGAEPGDVHAAHGRHPGSSAAGAGDRAARAHRGGSGRTVTGPERRRRARLRMRGRRRRGPGAGGVATWPPSWSSPGPRSPSRRAVCPVSSRSIRSITPGGGSCAWRRYSAVPRQVPKLVGFDPQR